MKMKKFAWIIALLAALCLIFAGCPGGRDDDDDDDDPVDIDLAKIFSATDTTQTTNNGATITATVSAESASFTLTVVGDGGLWGELVTPENAGWDVSGKKGIKFEYKAATQGTILIQDTDSIFIFGINGSDGWGAVSPIDDWTLLTLPFSILQRQTWFGSEHNFGTLPVIKLCFSTSANEAGDKFELRNLVLY